jgi:O-antigen ligase
MTAPLERVLPASVRSNEYTRALIHPQAAQIQTVLGAERPRPAAPFGYANFWGNIVSILLVWWVVFMWCGRGRLRRAVGVGVCVVAVVPVVYSLDRALWAGLALSLLFVIARTAQRRGLGAAVAILSVLAVAGALFVLSPFRGLVVQRALHGESNAVRSYLTAAAIDGAEHSPILGYGGTRKTLGSNRSIAIGPTAHCPQCGNLGIGSNGQFWLVLFAQGFVGAALYVGFFGRIALAYWRDTSAVGTAGVLVVLLSLFYMFFYNALPSTLALTMISIGVLVGEGLPHARRSRRGVALRARGRAALSHGG